jgi:hypothetical protein
MAKSEQTHALTIPSQMAQGLSKGLVVQIQSVINNFWKMAKGRSLRPALPSLCRVVNYFLKYTRPTSSRSSMATNPSLASTLAIRFGYCDEPQTFFAISGLAEVCLLI